MELDLRLLIYHRLLRKQVILLSLFSFLCILLRYCIWDIYLINRLYVISLAHAEEILDTLLVLLSFSHSLFFLVIHLALLLIHLILMFFFFFLFTILTLIFFLNTMTLLLITHVNIFITVHIASCLSLPLFFILSPLLSSFFSLFVFKNQFLFSSIKCGPRWMIRNDCRDCLSVLELANRAPVNAYYISHSLYDG